MDIDFNKGQHFLIDKKIIEREIKEAEISNKDKIIEIGAGKGILTQELTKKAKTVLAFEIDKKFKKDLDRISKKYNNLKIMYSDALKSDWRGYNKIVSNIPYFISGDLVLKAIRDNIEEIVVIAGEKFKNILEKREGKIGIIANLFFNINYICEVKKKSFMPPPKVNSWIIKLTKKKKLNMVDNVLKRILCKNGKIKNAIIYSLVEEGKTKRMSREILANMNLNEKILEKSVKRITGKFLIRLREHLRNTIF